MMVRVPAGDITNLHYNFVVTKPLVEIRENDTNNSSFLWILNPHDKGKVWNKLVTKLPVINFLKGVVGDFELNLI